MPDSKITALTALTAADPANDMIPIVDVSDTPPASGNTKRISINNILACSPTATLASATISGDLTVRTNKLSVTNTGVGFGMTPITPFSGVVGTTGAVFFRTTDPAAPVASPYIQAPTSTGFSSVSSVYGFWYQGCGIGNPALNNVSVITDSTERYKIDSTGVATWSNVGGVAGTAMTLNSTGLGLGVTPSAWPAASKAIDVDSYGANYAIAAATQVGISRNCYYNGTNWIYKLTTSAQRFEQDNGGGFKWFNAPSGTAGTAITGANAFVQAMTLDASGNLLVGKSVSLFSTVGVEASGTGFISATNSASTNATTNLSVYSTGAAAFRFYVGLGGTVFATNTTISAISDARLKENVQDLDVGLGAILALKPRKFDWKAGKGKDIKGDRGFIAQEFEQVFPQLVDEWKDEAPEGEAPYKSVRQDLIPVLVKAIQELAAEVNALKNA